MTWNPQIELVKRSAEIAANKHPDGYNKKQLIEASEEVFGGYGKSFAKPFPLDVKPIQTMEDVGNAGNAMALIDGHYPVGMSGCYVVGINGGCGYGCPVFKEGDCEEPQEFDLKDYITCEEYEVKIALSYWNENEIQESSL